MSSIQLYYSKWKAIKLILMSSVFVLPAIWMLYLGEELTWLWVLCLLFFGLGYVVGAYLLFDRRAQIIIDEKGIFDRSILNEIISWSVILEADLFFVSNQKFIALIVDSSFKPTAKFDFRQRVTYALNKNTGFNRFNLNIAHLSVNAELLELFLKKIVHTKDESTVSIIKEFKRQASLK